MFQLNSPKLTSTGLQSLW